MTKPIIDLSDDFFGAVLNCAVRYCIGRQSYMPSLVTDFIRPYLPYLSNKTLWCFERDLSGTTFWGDENIDEPLWLSFKADIEREINRRAELKTDGAEMEGKE